MTQSCILSIEDVDFCTKNRVTLSGYMNYAAQHNNYVVFEIDSLGNVLGEPQRGYMLKKVFPKMKIDFLRIFKLGSSPHEFTLLNIDSALEEFKSSSLSYKY